MAKTLAASSTGVVHSVILLRPQHMDVTACGRIVDWHKWTRISTLDSWMVGKGKPTIARKVPDPKCGKCFPIELKAV